MSKNLTRKGLALGALVALGSSVIAGAPAFAANELNLQPSLGTTYGSVIGESFTLNANTNPGYASSELSKLKFNIVNPSKAALTFKLDGTTATVGDGVTQSAAADNSGYVADPTGSSGLSSITVSTSATATSSVTVQAWVDSDFQGDVDPGEWASAVQTITFNKASEVTWTTEFTKPVIGDTKFVAYVSAAPSINVAQLTNTSAGLLFTNEANGSESVSKALTPSSNYDSATGKLKFNAVFTGGSISPTTVTNGRYSAQAYFLAGGAAYNSANLVGSEVAYAVALSTVGSIQSPQSATSDNVITEGDTTGNNGLTVRSTATSVPVSILVKDTDAVALKSTEVTVHVVETLAGGTDTTSPSLVALGNYDTSSFTAGGSTLKDTTNSVTREEITFKATTDADGKVIFNLTAAAKDGDSVQIYATAPGINADPTNYATLSWQDAAPTALVNNNVHGSAAVLKQAKGSTFTLNYSVIDQFGAAIPTADKYRVELSDGTDFFYPAVSAGKASQSITLSSTATNKLYDAFLQVKGTNGNFTDVAPEVSYLDLSVVVGTSTAASKITTTGNITSVGSQAALSTTATNTIAKDSRTSVLDTVAFVAGDKNLGATNSVAGTETTGVVVAGTVADATGAATYAAVTLSGTGLNFIVDGTLYAAGTVTVQTDASGAFAGVRVLSTKSGKQTLTVSSGTASSSYVLDFGSPATTAGTTVAFTAPTSIVPGKTLTITGKLTDKFGNAVTTNAGQSDFKVAYTGPGFLVTAVPTETDADGAFSVSVLLGSADTGVATFTATYAGTKAALDSTATGTSADIVKSVSVTVGAVAAASAKANVVGKTKAFTVSVSGNASAKNVVVKVAGKTFKTLMGSSSAKTYTVKAPKGTHKVTVYVGGKLIATKTVSVK
jgi:hypothetical protein